LPPARHITAVLLFVWAKRRPALVLTRGRAFYYRLIAGFVERLSKRGISPSGLSLLGFLLSLLAAALFLVAPGRRWCLFLAAAAMLASGFIDSIDGAVARTSGKASQFGAFMDSVTDRYSDVVITCSFIVAGLCSVPSGLVLLAGSLLVSYTRARGESLRVDTEGVGFAERSERLIVLCVVSVSAYFYPPLFEYGVILLAALTNITAILRIMHVHDELRRRESK